MAIALTEKVTAKLAGGIKFKVWLVENLAAGSNTLTAETLGFNYINLAEYRPMQLTISATTTALPGTTTNAGKTIVIGPCGGSGTDRGSLRVYGY